MKKLKKTIRYLVKYHEETLIILAIILLTIIIINLVIQIGG